MVDKITEKNAFPEINFEEYISTMAKDLYIHDVENKHINICISGGGLAVMYAAGVLGVIVELVKQRKLQIHHIYSTSAGAMAGILFIMILYNDLFEEKI